MKKIAFAGLAMGLGLSGCASTMEVLDMQPTAVYHSERSQSEVANCLADKNNTHVREWDDGSKVVLMKNTYGGVSLAFSVYEEGEGSRILYRRAFGTIGSVWRQCIGIDEEHEDAIDAAAEAEAAALEGE